MSKLNNSKTQAAIIYAATAIAIIGANFHTLLWKSAYYHCMALFIAASYFVFRRLTHNKPALNKAVNITFWFAINNLVDEIFFVPGAWQINEYVFAAIIAYIILKPKKNAG